MPVALHKFYERDHMIEFYRTDDASKNTFYSLGTSEEDYMKLVTTLVPLPEDRKPNFICIDVANGYSRNFVACVERIRKLRPGAVIMAGNVVTPDMTYDLLERGADIVKIGIGPGSVCTTRKITGVGYPQLSAILECADAAHGAGGLVCGDGGITTPGDLAKAFAAGADLVMCGGIFAGHAECDGEIEYDVGYDHPAFVMVNGEPELNTFQVPRRMTFRGMSSQEAMDDHYGGKADYRAAEGKSVTVPYKGLVENTIKEMLGGLRSACTYVGASELKHLPKCATFIKVNRTHNQVFGA
jgi:GMP reductase